MKGRRGHHEAHKRVLQRHSDRPDLGRFEAANVGVLLFCPEKHFIQALTLGNNSRIIRLFWLRGT